MSFASGFGLAAFGLHFLGSQYERPEAPVEQVWPQDEATKNAALLTEGLQKWSDFFTDERLTKLIELGLQNNRSLRSAFYSVEQARAQYNVSRADLLPSVAVQAEETAGRTPASTTSTGLMSRRTPTRPVLRWHPTSLICSDASAI